MEKKSLPILLVVDHFGSGGAQRQIVAIANGLVAKGYQVHVFIYYPEHDHHRAGLNKRVIVKEVKKTNRYGINVILTLIKLLYKNKYFSAMAFLNTPSFYLEIASVFYIGKTKLFYSERSALEMYGKGMISRLRKRMHKICTHITSNSIGQTEELKEYFGSTKVSYLPNALPESFFNAQCSPSIKINGGFSVIAHTAKNKNHNYVALALIKYKELYEQCPPVINWYGQLYDEEQLLMTRALLKEHGLEHTLIFHGAIKNVPEVLSQTKFLIHPSLFESSANAVAEALTTGTPVILGNIGDHQAIVDISSSGLVVDLLNPEQLAKALYEYNNLSLSTYSLMSQNARKYAERVHKSDVVIAQYENILC
jgi:glycosyltransferase involved in cell wall biosynthesis